MKTLVFQIRVEVIVSDEVLADDVSLSSNIDFDARFCTPLGLVRHEIIGGEVIDVKLLEERE